MSCPTANQGALNAYGPLPRPAAQCAHRQRRTLLAPLAVGQSHHRCRQAWSPPQLPPCHHHHAGLGSLEAQQERPPQLLLAPRPAALTCLPEQLTSSAQLLPSESVPGVASTRPLPRPRHRAHPTLLPPRLSSAAQLGPLHRGTSPRLLPPQLLLLHCCAPSSSPWSQRALPPQRRLPHHRALLSSELPQLAPPHQLL